MNQVSCGFKVFLNEVYLSLQAEQGSFSQLVSPGTVAVVMQFFEKYEVMMQRAAIM